MMEYVCRYCHTSLGRIESSGLTDSQLGFDQLTLEEREDIISKDMSGGTQVRVVCESCQELIETYPEMLLLPHLYH
jgi:hypothetical protein